MYGCCAADLLRGRYLSRVFPGRITTGDSCGSVGPSNSRMHMVRENNTSHERKSPAHVSAGRAMPPEKG